MSDHFHRIQELNWSDGHNAQRWWLQTAIKLIPKNSTGMYRWDIRRKCRCQILIQKKIMDSYISRFKDNAHHLAFGFWYLFYNVGIFASLLFFIFFYNPCFLLQVWCSTTSDERAQHALLTDVHSPEKVRLVDQFNFRSKPFFSSLT